MVFSDWNVRILSTIDFSHLRLLAVFATVVETGSFAAAARQLSTSRSRVSEQVSKLEAALGVRLLQRSTRQLIVTKEGSDVFNSARQLPAVLMEVEGAVTSAEPSGRVAVTMNHDTAHRVVLPLLEEFQQRYPLIELDLVLDDHTRDFISEQIDIGIRIGLPKDNSLVGRILYEESLALYASPDYLKANGSPKTAKDIRQRRWVLLAQLSSDSVLLKSRQSGKTIELHPEKFSRCNSPFMMQRMVIAGLGIGALLPSMVREEVRTKKLVRIMPSLKSDPLIFSLVYPSRKQVPQRVKVVIDFLLEKVRYSFANNA